MHPLDELRSLIDQHGWAVRNVADVDPALCFSYTIGLSAHEHPELVMTGLPPAVAHAFLNIAGNLVVNGHGSFLPGDTTTDLSDGPPMPVLEVIDISGLTAVEAIYGEVRAVQIVWTDSKGHPPWEAGYANPHGSQPLLGPRPQ